PHDAALRAHGALRHSPVSPLGGFPDMRKTRLLTPGPTPVPERVLLRMAQPILHHRSPDFEALFERVRGNLKELFGTQQDVLTFVSTGSGAMEASITNFMRRGDK